MGLPGPGARWLVLLSALGGAVVLLDGCAAIDGQPRYRTNVIRTPPTSAQGRQCLNQCDATRLQCESVQSSELSRCEAGRAQQERNCRTEASNARAYCLRNRAPGCDLKYDNVLGLCRDRIADCRPDTARCDTLSEQCFVRCGGTIRRERVCVQNCGPTSSAPRQPDDPVVELYRAGLLADSQTMQRLLAQGADVNRRLDNGELALFGAASNREDDTRVVKLLLDAGAAVDGRNARTERTALHGAAHNRNRAIAALLLRAGANPDARDVAGFTPLHTSASQNPDPELMRLLLANGADVNARTTSQGLMALEYVDHVRERQAADYLIRAGTDASVCLRYAAGRGIIDVVRAMLGKGADVNSRGLGGRTALHDAAGEPDSRIVKLLLEHGADRALRDTHGLTALAIAQRRSLRANIELLQGGGAQGSRQPQP
jgi:ankyrin repeat protein